MKNILADDEFLEVMKSSELPEKKLTPVVVDGREVCLLKIDGTYYAFSSVCTHIGGRLSEGRIGKGAHVVCPEHRAVFDAKTGESLSFPRRGLATYEVKIEDSRILLRRHPNPEVWRERFPTVEDARFS